MCTSTFSCEKCTNTRISFFRYRKISKEDSRYQILHKVGRYCGKFKLLTTQKLSKGIVRFQKNKHVQLLRNSSDIAKEDYEVLPTNWDIVNYSDIAKEDYEVLPTNWDIVKYSKMGQTLKKKTTRYYVPTSWDIVKYSKIGQTLQKKTTRYYPPVGRRPIPGMC